MFTYIVLGIFAGASYALASLGIVLTYKTSGIFNFAYGGVAMFCAFVFWQLRDHWGLSQWISIPLMLLVVAPGLGLVLEALFRPLTEAAVEVQIVVSLGVLSFLLTFAPLPWMFNDTERDLPTVFSHRNFLWLGVHVKAGDLGTLIVAVVLALALSLLLSRTRLGVATRAVVDNRELAGLIAVNSGRVNQVAWVVSTVFAAISGVLLSSQNGLIVYVLPALVLYAFFAAVFGRLTSLPLAFGGAIAMGIIQSILQEYSSSGNIARIEASLPYLALLVLLVVYGSRLKEVRSSLRPTMTRSFGAQRVNLWWGLAAALAAGIIIPLAFSSPIQLDVAQAMAFAVVAVTVVVLTGWTGQISIAQMSFAGIGAATVAHLTNGHPGLFLPALLLSVAIAAPVGILIGLPSLRLSGIFLALATLAFALVMDNLVFGIQWVINGSTGIDIAGASIGPLSFKSYTAQFYLCLVVLTVVAGGAYLVKRGPVGRRLNMVRDSPIAAQTAGASLTLTKLAVFAACGMIAAVGGGLLALTQQNANASSYSWNQSLELLLLVVVGGRLLVSGAIVAGGLELMSLLPGVPAVVHTYEPLGVALIVIAIAKGVSGLPENVVRQTRYCLAVLYRLPRPEWLAGSAGAHRTAPARLRPAAPGRATEAGPGDVTAETPALSALPMGAHGG